jgi:SAM-dependent methyltransferase
MAVIDDIRAWWDQDAATYDNAAGHRPRTAAERAAWTAALARLLPAAPARVLDCGAGTGFLTLIAARLGHRVTALDLSGEMLAHLTEAAKAARLTVEVVEGPAGQPPPGPFDAVIERHLVWTLPDADSALAAWRRVTEPGARLVLVESLWGGADPIEAALGRGREALRRLQRRPPDHHDRYPPAIRAALPLGTGAHPSRLVELVEAVGWRRAQLVRLRDVEWATLINLPPVERLLGVAPRFAITAIA